ncbi:TPA: hypothetical protein JLF22_004123 [Escherichia coli]|uniref:hypothetical protein n=1 Tax=Escherichia coli TaxID=562 RepID=UPI0009AE137F|nr:hypothetical protein [Escherichia coli]ARA37129.1 hypothetical protein AM440_15855 [Escherichia coli]PAS76728.1 hypothetical protein CDN88_21210 [Escherichia coli]SQP13159.1 Replication regulatory protein RepB [Escherichia coli]HAV9171477.1 hypothetical protein [Escherichia coli]HBV0132845.1 hypothetical protein [Escherichia coli]
MAFKDDSKKYSFHSHDINESRYVLQRLKRSLFNINESNRFIESSPNSELIRKVNEIINENNADKNVREYVSDYKRIYTEFVNFDLSWIKSDFNAGLYLWFSLFVYKFESNRERLVAEEREWFKKARPISSENIIVDIKDYALSKINQITSIKDDIDFIHKEYQQLTGTKRLGWLKNDKEQTTWAYQYLEEKDDLFKRLYMGDSVNALDFIKVYYDLHIDDSGVRLTFIEMSNAWNQQRYRAKRKQNNKKALSGYISIDAKLKLKEIAKKEKLSESEMIEFLIMAY